MTNRIKKAIKELGLENKVVFTTGELDVICRKSKSSLFEVMKYLRFQR